MRPITHRCRPKTTWQLPRLSKSASSLADRLTRRRNLNEMKQDRPVDATQEADYLEDLAQECVSRASGARPHM